MTYDPTIRFVGQSSGCARRNRFSSVNPVNFLEKNTMAESESRCFRPLGRVADRGVEYNDTTVRNILDEALNDLFAKYGKPEIAPMVEQQSKRN